MDLLTEKIGKLYRAFLIPSLTSAAALSIFGLVDMLAIGQGIGADGVAAFSVVTPLFGVTSFLGVFLGIGGSVPMAIAKGTANKEKYNAYFTASFVLLSLLAIMIWAGFCVFTEEIYMFFGANERLMPLVKEYGNWIIWCFPFFFFSIYFACIIRCDGNPNITMIAVIVSGLFNVFGDWFLVFIMDMGMAGAAIATVAGNVIQVIIFVGYMFSKKCGFRFVVPFQWFRAFKKITMVGFSTGVIDVAYISLTILLNNMVLKYGTEVDLAVFGVAFTCSSMFQRLYCGVGQAVQPIVSANLGAVKPERIVETLKLSIKTELIMSVIFTLVGILLPIQLVQLFIEINPEILDAAPVIIRPFFLSLLTMGINMLATYYFQSIMHSVLATVIALLRGLALSGLLVIVLPMFMGLPGIWWGLVIAEMLTFVITFISINKTKRSLYNYKQ